MLGGMVKKRNKIPAEVVNRMQKLAREVSSQENIADEKKT
jgi:hypothetical protein